MGLYFHEIGHAIGLVHEHQLPDRGDYVTVLWSNVDPPMKSAFFKYSESLLDRFEIPYDITSIMHYGINVSKNRHVSFDFLHFALRSTDPSMTRVVLMTITILIM